MQNVPREHFAILSTFIKLTFVLETFVLSIFEWLLTTGFTVLFSRTSPNQITWTAEFNGVTPSILGEEIKSYILNNLTTQIFDDKNSVRIGDHYLYQSDYISAFEIQFDLVDDVSGLLTPGSPIFQQYEERFCADVSCWFFTGCSYDN